MQMANNTSKKLADETVQFVKKMSGDGRTEFIDLIFDQYKYTRNRQYPKREVRKFYELLSRLVKTFGH